MKAIQKEMIPVQRIDMNEWLIHFNIEDKTDVEGNAYQEADEVTVNDPLNRSEVISAIIRDKYSADQVEAIIANYMAGDDDQMIEYQRWRNLAKAVADGLYLKSELEDYLVAEIVDRIKSVEQNTEAITEVLNENGLLS